MLYFSFISLGFFENNNKGTARMFIDIVFGGGGAGAVIFYLNIHCQIIGGHYKLI